MTALTAKCATAMGVLALGLAIVSPIGEAETFNISDGDVQGLIDAIQTANTNGEADTINLANDGTYTLNSNDIAEIPFKADGNNGLPSITSEITIEGNSASIRRASALKCVFNENMTSNEFRIFHVSGILTLRSLQLRNGCIDAGNYDNDTPPSASGGAISLVSGQLKTKSVTLTENAAAFNGGAIYVETARISIRKTTFYENFAGIGGAIFQIGTNQLIVKPSPSSITASDIDTMVTEVAQPSTGESNVNVQGVSTVIAENASYLSKPHLINSTFVNNEAITSGSALSNHESDLALVNVTIYKNEGGPAIDHARSFVGGEDELVLINSILANNSPSNCNIEAIFRAKGMNLDTDGTCKDSAEKQTSTGDKVFSASPQLDGGGLADNGGPTKTLALQPNSPAVDAATGCPPPDTDQRGAARPQGDACDLGAFELRAEPPPVGEDLGPVRSIRLTCDDTNARVSFEIVLNDQQNLFGSLSCNEVLTRGSAEAAFNIPDNRTFTPGDVQQVNLLYYAQKDAALVGGATSFAQRTAEGVLEGDVLRRNVDYILRVNSGGDLNDGAHSESGDVGDHPFLAADLDRDGRFEPQGDDAFSTFSTFTNFDPSAEQPNKQPRLVFEAQRTGSGVGGFGLEGQGIEPEGPGAMHTLPMVTPLSVTDVRLTPSVDSDATVLDLAVEGSGIAKTELTVYDLTGRRVLSERARADRLSVQAGTLPAGVYLYEVTVRGHDGSVERTDVRKVVVSR